MWVTAFYAPLIPLGIPISLAALIIYYWVEKYLIIKRHKRPPIISPSLNKEMTDLLEIVPLFMAVKKKKKFLLFVQNLGWKHDI